MYIIQSSYRLCRPQPEPSSALGESEKDLFLRRTIEKSLLQPVDDMRRPYTQAFHDIVTTRVVTNFKVNSLSCRCDSAVDTVQDLNESEGAPTTAKNKKRRRERFS